MDKDDGYKVSIVEHCCLKFLMYKQKLVLNSESQLGELFSPVTIVLLLVLYVLEEVKEQVIIFNFILLEDLEMILPSL